MESKSNKRATRADVAKMADVTGTIVSYVINNNRYVDKEKRKRVEEAIKLLNYRPNNIARALKVRSSSNIVFIADQITNEHFSQIINELDIAAYDKGYIVSICANRNTREFVSHIISRQFDGIVISSISFPEEYIQYFIDAKIPVVLLKNRNYKEIKGIGMIDTGLYKGAKECVQHLVDRGRKSILYLDRTSSRGNFSTDTDFRLKGYKEQMKKNGIEISEDNIITGCENENQVIDKIKKRISDGFKADGIFARNDRLACMGMTAVKSLGLKIPEDIAIIGFDNSSLSKYTTPTLTTMEMQRSEIGKSAIEMLYQMIENGPEAALSKEFDTRLIIREST